MVSDTRTRGLAEAPSEVGARRPLGRLAGALDRCWERLAALSPATFAVLLSTIVVVRGGVSFNGFDTGIAIRSSESFPRLVDDWRANSAVGPFLAGLFGVESQPQWFLLNATVICAVAVISMRALSRRVPDRSALVVVGTWLALASFPIAVLQKVGWYDIYTVAGSFLVVLGRRRPAAVVGGLLLGMTNAEQGLLAVTSAFLVAVALTPDGTDWRQAAIDVRRSELGQRLIAAAAAAAAGRLLVLMAFRLQGTDPVGRGGILRMLLGDSIGNNLKAAGSGIFAWFGLAWGLVLLTWFLRDWSLKRWMLMLAALAALPALATVATLDGTRVFAMVSLAPLLVLAGWVADRLATVDAATVTMIRRVTVAVLLLAIVLPALIADTSGFATFQFPWARIYVGP